MAPVLLILKGQFHEIFDLRFFLGSVSLSPKPLSIPAIRAVVR